ncbi:MAG TPA: hypothetical protein VGD60_00395 [Candidatus Acidoferrales bacterium]
MKKFLLSSKVIATALIFVLALGASALRANDSKMSFKIPPVNIPLHIKGQEMNIVASGTISMARKEHDLNEMQLHLNADLAGLQQDIGPVLGAVLDKNSRCADRIQIQDATLVPAPPNATLAIVHLHYERWVCAKLFGNEEVKRLIGGNATLQLKLTPSVGPNHTELRLKPELGPIEADGSLGEVLRLGNVGDLVRDKIQETVLAAVQKGTDLGATLPAEVQDHVTIQDVAFHDAGEGRLVLTLDGDAQLTNDELQALENKFKKKLPIH